MPLNKDIKKVLMIGSGPIVIGQAAEFDYAGAQACRVLKAAGVNDVNISASDLCNKVVAAITAEGFSYVGTTGTMTWDASGAATKVPVIVELQ